MVESSTLAKIFRTMKTSTSKLSVKELAGPVGRSVSFLYKARMAGLPMTWNNNTRTYEATVESVKRWIAKHKFRVVEGDPRFEP